MKRISFLVAFFMVVSLLPFSQAMTINDPENVSHMNAELIQSGKLRLVSKSNQATAQDLRLKLYIPQNDSRQLSQIKKVIGPQSYNFTQDVFKNTMILMEWETPPLDTEIDYLVSTYVEVWDQSSEETRNFPTTELVKPSQEIIENAYTSGGGEKGIKNILKVAEWVNNYVEYDLSYEDTTLSAKWVCDNRKGVCDEFTNLYLSMLKVLGYRSWYVAGYAFLGGKQEEENSFGPHAWAEIDYNGKTYSADPTWAESPVDATHFALARLPDSNFTEYTETKSFDVSIDWQKEETVVNLIEFEEEPRMNVELTVVPKRVYGSKNMLFLADITADECILSRSRLVSCVDQNGNPLIEIDNYLRSVMFCDRKTNYWIGKSPKARTGTYYSCPVTLATGGSRSNTLSEVTEDNDYNIDLELSTEKILVPSQTFEATASVTNMDRSEKTLRVFAIFNEKVAEMPLRLEGESSENIVFVFTAPITPGEHILNIFSSSGDLKKETLSVIENRQFKITQIEIPGKMVTGTKRMVNITIENFGNASSATVKISFSGDENQKDVEMSKGERKTAVFPYSPAIKGKNVVSITVLDELNSYQDAWVGNIEVIAPVTFKDSVSRQLEAFFLAIIDFFQSIFGQ